MAAVLAVVALASAAVGARPSEAPAPADLRALALERSGGDLDRLGVMVTYGPDGAVERAITGHEFLAVAASLVGAGTHHVADPQAFGLGYGKLPRLGFPRCDHATVVLQHFGPPGMSIVHAARSDLGDVGADPVCGGFYGPTHTWRDVSFDASRVTLLLGPCISADVVVPPPLPGQAACGGTFACGGGNGIVLVMGFFGLSLDAFVGSTAHVVLGEGVVGVEDCLPGLPWGLGL